MGRIDLKTFTISGRIGTLVAYTTIEGKQVYRKYTVPRDPKTPKQTAYRMKFGLVNKSLSRLNKVIKIGHKERRNAYRSVISHVLKHGVDGEYPNYKINYSEVQVSEGKLKLPSGLVATYKDELDAIQLTWNPRTENRSKFNNHNDKVNIVCYDESTGLTKNFFNVANSSDGVLVIDKFMISGLEVSSTNEKPNIINRDNLHFWMYLSSDYYNANSSSWYIKTIVR